MSMEHINAMAQHVMKISMSFTMRKTRISTLVILILLEVGPSIVAMTVISLCAHILSHSLIVYINTILQNIIIIIISINIMILIIK